MKSIHTSFILSSSISRSGRTASDASFSLLRKRSHYACKVSSGLSCSPKLRNITYAFLCKYLLLLELMSTTYYSSLPLFYTSIGIMKVKLPQALFP